MVQGGRYFVYEDRSTWAVVKRKAEAGVLGFVMGSCAGAVAHTIHARQISAKAKGPAAFLGFIFAVGSMISR